MNLPPSFPLPESQQDGPDHFRPGHHLRLRRHSRHRTTLTLKCSTAEPNSVRLSRQEGRRALGFGAGSCLVTLRAEPDGRTLLQYQYGPMSGGQNSAAVPASPASRNSDTLRSSGSFFSALEWRIAPQRAPAWRGWLAGLSARLAEIRHEARRFDYSSAGNGIGRPSPARS